MRRGPEDEAELTPAEARQGSRGGWQVRVLVLSTLAAAAGMFLYFYLYTPLPNA